MDAATAALGAAGITALAALGTTAITGRVALGVARDGRDERRAAELSAALAQYGAALDRLGLEVQQLAPAPSRVDEAVLGGLTRLRKTNWLLSQVTRHTLARPVTAAIEPAIAAHNRLALIAPPNVLQAMQQINELLAAVSMRDATWDERWSAARSEFLLAARAAVDDAPRRSLVGRLVARLRRG